MKKLIFTLSLLVTFNVAAATINESTDPILNETFLDAGPSNLDTDTGLYWLNFSDLVGGDLTLGYSVTNNVEWFGPQGWRLPTYDEVYNLFDKFFEPEFVDSGNGTMTIAEGDGTNPLLPKRNSWILNFGSDATVVSGSEDPNDGILNSIGLYLDENSDVQMMGVIFDTFTLETTIFGPDYNSTGLDINTAYADYGVFMVYDSVVPVPAAVWLFGSGLLGLLLIARRRN